MDECGIMETEGRGLLFSGGLGEGGDPRCKGLS